MPQDKPPGTEPGASHPQPKAPAGPVRRPPGGNRVVPLDAYRSHGQGPTIPHGQKAPRKRSGVELGLFTRELELAAGALNERPGALRSLVASLKLRYAPQGMEESLIVDRMASLWVRLARLKRAAQEDPSARPPRNVGPVPARPKGPSVAVAQQRLERSMSRMHKDLEFLQRMRGAAPPRQEP